MELKVKRARRAVRELEKLNSIIVIGANTVDVAGAGELCAIFERDFDYPVYAIRRSRYVAELLFSSESLREKRKWGGLATHWMCDVITQFEALFEGL